MVDQKSPSQRKGQGQEVPTEFAQVPPYPSMDHSFTLQAVMEMQKTLGILSGKIDSVDSTVKEIGRDVSRHGKWIFAATAVALLLFTIVGFMAKVAWDIAKVKLGF